MHHLAPNTSLHIKSSLHFYSIENVVIAQKMIHNFCENQPLRLNSETLMILYSICEHLLVSRALN